MTKGIKTGLIATTALALAAGPALADMTATATTDLNLRSGPGPQYEVVGVIDGDESVDMAGCTEGGEWCEVTYDGTSGWAYSAYLTAPIEGPEAEPVVVYQNTADVAIIEYEDDNAADAAAGGTLGAAAGALLVGGPVAIAAGAVLGMAGGAAADTPEATVTYVRSNPVEPVFLEGEVARGAGIPQEIEVYEVPDSDYSYLNVNRQTVIIDPETRRIVEVIR